MCAEPKQTQPHPHSGELKSPVRRIELGSVVALASILEKWGKNSKSVGGQYTVARRILCFFNFLSCHSISVTFKVTSFNLNKGSKNVFHKNKSRCRDGAKCLQSTHVPAWKNQLE